MVLSRGFKELALRLQEAAVSHENIRARLNAAIKEHYTAEGMWCYVQDVFGTETKGDVVFWCDSALYQAPYRMKTTDEKATCDIDFAAAVEVTPQTVYRPIEATRGSRDGSGLATSLDAATGRRSSDTGGNGTTHAPRESGNQAAVPSSALAGATRETLHDSISLCESAATCEAIVLKEAKADYEIKLIAPGKGSSAFYPAEVLKRDGPKVFKKETHVYLNHPTAAEEAARPENDVKNLAGVLTQDAFWSESHAKGPGLYSRMKVFADHGQMVEEKAPYVGMSIRAAGIAESGRKHDGLPILKELTAAESVDVVTRAGAGGMILTESARQTQNKEAASMAEDPNKGAEDISKLRETIQARDGQIQQLLERAIRGDARDEAAKILRSMSLPEVSKQRVIESVLRDIPKKDGAVDVAKFTEAVNAAAKDEGAYVASLTGSGNVIGMGGAPVDPVKARESQARQEDEIKNLRESGKNVFLRLVGDPKAAEAMAARGAA